MNRSRSLTIVLALVIMCLVPQAASAGYGDLDADFGTGGKVGDLRISNPTSLLIQQDRKILVAGGSPYAGLIARLNRDGSLDKTFGVDGFFSIPGGGAVYDMDLLDDQRIATVRDGNRIIVLDSNGKLDPGFGIGGVLDFGTAESSFKVTAIATQSGSRLLVSGRLGGFTGARIIRLDPTGAEDLSFGDSGAAKVQSASTGGPGASEIATTPQGDILLGLATTHEVNAGPSGLVVLKFTESGQRVLDFGSGGVARDPNKTNKSPQQIVVARDGSFIALNKTQEIYYSRGGGHANIYSEAYYSAAGNLEQGPSNRFGAQGATSVDGPGLAISFARNVAVLKPDLSLDSKFARNGRNAVTAGACSSWEQLATDVDGSIVAAGSCEFLGGSSQLARFLGPNGGRPAPQTNIIGISWSKQLRGKPFPRSWPRVITGEALPGQGLSRVDIAIRRIDKPLPKKGLCGWLTDSGKKYSRRKKCSRPVFMTAKGRSSWRFDLARPLPPGDYMLYARAYTSDGRFNPINDDADTFRYFEVKRATKKK